MAVPAVITDLLVAIADNVPKGSDSVTTSTGPDEFFRAHAAIVRRLQAKGADVASAATVDLGAINDGSYVKITGTTTITSFGTIAAGVERTLLFADALTLTHDVLKIILPGAANIVTAAEDVAVFVSEGAGLWRCKSYQRKAVPPSVPLDASVVTAKIADLAVTTVKVADDAVTYAKIQNVSATDKVLGRVSAGAGDIEEIACTPFARTVLDDADQKTALTTLGVIGNAVEAKTAAYTVVAADRGKLIDASGTWTLSLTAAATLGNGFSFSIRNTGTGIITIDPNGTEAVDGVATIDLSAGDSCLVVCNGTAFQTVGRRVGRILQVVHLDTGALATGTTIIPNDDTIPQQTEGDQYMSLAITPIAATSTLRVDVTTMTSPSTGVWVTQALFRDDAANAIGASFSWRNAGGFGVTETFSVQVAAGSTASTTLKLRAGPSAAATLTFNGVSGGRFLGGVMASSIRITEIAA